jgi:hypothetical protein
VADANTITRIGGILKNTYSDMIVEQQNLLAALRKKFTKAQGVRLGGDHYEISVRVGGNRAGVGARNSDDPLPTPSRQREKKFQVFDRAIFGVIKVYDKDIENSASDKQAFANHLDDEVTQMVKDVMKHMNIITFGDGTGMLATINANTAAAVTFVGATGTSFGQFGTRYLQEGDVIDVWDPTFVTRRTPAGGATITAIEPSTRTVTVNIALTLTAGDIVTRVDSANKEYIGLHLATDNSSSVTFQGLSRSTYPILRGLVISAGGGALAEDYLQQLLSLIESASGETPSEFVSPHAQWDAYMKLGISLKRYMDTSKMDRGFTELEYGGRPFVKDVDCPPMCIYAPNYAYIQNGVVSALDWAQRDGSILKWDAGYAAWKAWTREYGNYVYPRPNTSGRVEALAVGAAYLR